mmetsp:Transcript_29698/g.71426  ORF Transcript_29698/g.71426 Transcript_29698/m.71426 type:complete len:459 (-) Transcript_29698:51-1427(-)
MDKCPFLPEVQCIFAEKNDHKTNRNHLTCLVCFKTHCVDDCDAIDEARAMIRESKKPSRRRESRSRSRSKSTSRSRSRSNSRSTYDSDTSRGSSRCRRRQSLRHTPWNMNATLESIKLPRRSAFKQTAFQAMTMLFYLMWLGMAATYTSAGWIESWGSTIASTIPIVLPSALKRHIVAITRFSATVVRFLGSIPQFLFGTTPQSRYVYMRVCTPNSLRTIFADTQASRNNDTTREPAQYAFINLIPNFVIEAVRNTRRRTRRSALRANNTSARTDTRSDDPIDADSHADDDNDVPDDLPLLEPGEAWFVCDSCANRHYHPDGRFVFRGDEMKYPIGGLTGSNQAETGQFGIFCANVRDDKKKVHPITSVAFTVPGERVGLFSEVQAAFAGNTIIREGNQTTGRHVILMKAPEGSSERPFIPFHFSRKSLLWYIRLYPQGAVQCMQARTYDPFEIWDRA